MVFFGADGRVLKESSDAIRGAKEGMIRSNENTKRHKATKYQTNSQITKHKHNKNTFDIFHLLYLRQNSCLETQFLSGRQGIVAFEQRFFACEKFYFSL
jgi:hypothetical protein